jgi:hypothetical protein
MGTGALLVLDAVRDINQVLREMTVGGSSGEDQQIVDSLRDDVSYVERDSEYHPEAPKDDRLYVQMLCNYWYPGELHYSPGNWWSVSELCKRLWDTEPTIVVHYMPECDYIDELTADELIRNAHLLTPTRVIELDDECTRTQRAIELRNQLGQHRSQSRANDSYGLDL